MAGTFQKIKDSDISDVRNFIRQIISYETIRHSNAGAPVSCKKKCAHCCKLYKIKCLSNELDIIWDRVKESFKSTHDLKRLQEQTTNWDKADKTCIFLKDGECSIHDIKPIACLNHNALSDPANCETGKKVRLLQNNKAYLIQAKLYCTYGTIDLHEGIYKKMNGVL